MLAALALLAMSTSGCATASSNACPREVVYSRQQQELAAEELATMAAGIVRDQFVPDYSRLRDQARACRGEQA